MLGSGEVHAWTARPPALSDETVARCAALLSGDERERISRFLFERHRREATVSRALVRATLARYVGRPASTFRYRLGPHGRPSVDPPCGIDFNATNHPGLVACAVTLAAALGIDVEPLSRGDEILEVARTVFSAPELLGLEALAEDARRDRAVSLWTLKEAYVKARGLGLSAPLHDIVVEFPHGERPTVRFLDDVDQPEGWWLDTRDVGDFRLAVAVRGAGEDVKLVVHGQWPVPSA